MATHSSVLAWRIPETGEPGGLPSMGSHRVGYIYIPIIYIHYIIYTYTHTHKYTHMRASHVAQSVKNLSTMPTMQET